MLAEVRNGNLPAAPAKWDRIGGNKQRHERKSMVDTTITQDALQTDIYDRIGVRTVINCRGATTAVGGSLMRPEVSAAMVEASKAFVVIEELNAKVGEVIAEITGAEAGYVTAGSAAGMLLAVAACIAGTDPEKIAKLPE